MTPTHARTYSRDELERLHAAFLELLPTVERHARVYFRCHARDAHRYEEDVAETVAVAWKAYLACVARGKDPAQFPTLLAGFAARHAGIGRYLCGTEAGEDVLSSRARRKRGFAVEPLPECDSVGAVTALADTRNASPLEQTQYRLDTAAWRETLSARDQALLDDLVAEYTTTELAQKRGVSPGAISQHRRKLVEKYAEFQGEEPVFGRQGRGR